MILILTLWPRDRYPTKVLILDELAPLLRKMVPFQPLESWALSVSSDERRILRIREYLKRGGTWVFFLTGDIGTWRLFRGCPTNIESPWKWDVKRLAARLRRRIWVLEFRDHRSLVARYFETLAWSMPSLIRLPWLFWRAYAPTKRVSLGCSTFQD